MPFECKASGAEWRRMAPKGNRSRGRADGLLPGYDPKGQAVDYVAKGWEARLIQQAFSGCFAGLAHGSPRLEGGWTSFCDRGNL